VLSWGAEHYLYTTTVHPLAAALHNASIEAGRGAGEIWLCSGLLGAGEKTVLGGPFLRAFYTVFDRGRRAIGLAPSRNCSVPRQPAPPPDALLAAQARLRAAAKAAPALLLAIGVCGGARSCRQARRRCRRAATRCC